MSEFTDTGKLDLAALARNLRQLRARADALPTDPERVALDRLSCELDRLTATGGLAAHGRAGHVGIPAEGNPRPAGHVRVSYDLFGEFYVPDNALTLTTEGTDR